jgi:drug/metabolite transporter (DMT)-like permease
MKSPGKAYTYALITVLFWSTVATAFKMALAHLNNIQLLVIANFVSLMVFFSMLVFRNTLSELKKVARSDWALSALQGFFNPFAYYLILFKAYSLLPAQVAQPANFIWPIVLMLLSVSLLGQPLRFQGILALLISFAGVVVLSSQGQLQHFKIVHPFGLSLCLLSSLIWSLFWIFNMKDKRNDLIKLFLSFAFSMLYILIFAALTHNLVPVKSSAMLPAVYIGLFEMGISFVLWLKALQYAVSTSKIANLIYITPFVSLLFIHFVLHEQLYYTSFIGLCLILGGIYTGQIKSNGS